jgi:ATP-dependent RNA helicase DDX52/ROK1
MEELFQILSSAAKIDKSKRPKKRQRVPSLPNHITALPAAASSSSPTLAQIDDKGCCSGSEEDEQPKLASRDRTGKRDTSDEKQELIHKEHVAAFRRSMSIRLANKHDDTVPDPVSSFHEIAIPRWWMENKELFHNLSKTIRNNIEAGRWKEPTPIQMQAIPALIERRDFIGAAPTGSGKSGAFIIPALILTSVPHRIFYAQKSFGSKKVDYGKKSSRQGEVRSIILAPSRELAAQLHREIERLGVGLPGGLNSVLLSKSNSAHIIAGTAGGKKGVDVLVATPLRLVDALQKGMKLDSVRFVVLDEADRLLDAADGMFEARKAKKEDEVLSEGDEEDEEEEEDQLPDSAAQQPGSSQSKTFLSQMDTILSAIPSAAIRALFSATVTPMVRSLAESILRDPVDVIIAAPGSIGGANPDIEQELMFVGREEGKLLAIRQFVQRGQLKPPVIVFVQSQERAQALFEELLYDGIHVDVLHAGRSKTARDNAVARFRRGDTWVLICTDLMARGVDFRAVNMVINYDLPTSGITYVHRIGRCGRAGRKGKAVTLFTEVDADNLRTIANVMKQSGCQVSDWMLAIRRKQRKQNTPGPRRPQIDTTPSYDKVKSYKRKMSTQNSKKTTTADDNVEN